MNTPDSPAGFGLPALPGGSAAAGASNVPGGPGTDPTGLTALVSQVANELFGAGLDAPRLAQVTPVAEPEAKTDSPAIFGHPDGPEASASQAAPPFSQAPNWDSWEAALRFDFPPVTSVPSGTAPVAPSSPSPALGRALFDPQAVRRQFPILQQRVNGKPLVWLDNAATTQKPEAVIERLNTFYRTENSNVHRAAHTLAARATEAYEGARESVRRFINASSKREIVFVRGSTEGINLVAQAWGRRHVQAGDEVVITWLEHHANIVPWQQLCIEKGARLRVAPVDDQGQVLLDEYDKLLGPKTRLVAFSQVSNALGTVTPAKEMIELAHRHGAVVLLDGAQGIPHLSVDVQALDCDFYVFSGHKVFAPTGIGVLYGKEHLLERMPPWQGGGNMIRDVTFERTTYQEPPSRFEAGTGSIADAVGLGAALEWLSHLGVEAVRQYEHELLDYATHCLAGVPGLRLVGTAPDKVSVISFVLAGQKTEEVGGLLDQEGIALRSGHHCAQPILRRFGLEATVRASLAPYNTRQDVDALVDALRRLQAGVVAIG